MPAQYRRKLEGTRMSENWNLFEKNMEMGDALAKVLKQ